MYDLEIRVLRLEETLRAVRRQADAAYELATRALQQAGAGTFGGALGSSLVWGRAVGTIGARSGATLGTGTVNLSRAPSGVLDEGSTTEDVFNGLPFDVADNVWVGMLPDDENQLIIILVTDPCDGLTEPA